MIYAFVGKAQAGKNTCAELWQLLDYYYNHLIIDTELKDCYKSDIDCILFHLERNTPSIDKRISTWQQKSFANKLKQIVAILSDCDVSKLEDDAFKNSTLPDFLITENHNTFRDLLRWLGTDVFREHVAKGIWCDTLFAELKQDSKWLITDCRFPLEADKVKSLGGKLIYISRDKTDGSTHESEVAMDGYVGYDYEINNNCPIEKLILQVKEIMINEKLI